MSNFRDLNEVLEMIQGFSTDAALIQEQAEKTRELIRSKPRLTASDLKELRESLAPQRFMEILKTHWNTIGIFLVVAFLVAIISGAWFGEKLTEENLEKMLNAATSKLIDKCTKK